MFWLSSAPGAFNVSYVASKLIMGMAHLSEIRPPRNPCATLPPSSTDARVFPDRRRRGEAGVQTTTGPVVISKRGNAHWPGRESSGCQSLQALFGHRNTKFYNLWGRWAERRRGDWWTEGHTVVFYSYVMAGKDAFTLALNMHRVLEIHLDILATMTTLKLWLSTHGKCRTVYCIFI